MYNPVIFHLSSAQTPPDNIFKFSPAPVFSSNIDYAKFSFGFHHYIHQTKDKMEIAEQFKNKKKVYHVLHPFEPSIDDYTSDIAHTSISFFKLKPKFSIIGRPFYKLWELAFMFDLIPTDSSHFISANVSKDKGSFVQATMLYRRSFSKNHSSDKYYAVSLDKSFSESHKNNKRLLLQSPALGSANFISADGGSNWKNKNVQEQTAFPLILSHIVSAVQLQAKNGNFICKIYESFTQSTVKLICALAQFYDNVYAVKPFSSRASNSEKYLVCLNFKFGKDTTKTLMINALDLILKQSQKHPDKYINTLFPQYSIPPHISSIITVLNTTICNNQFININSIVDFIHKQNYRGAEYQDLRNNQISASKFWIPLFFPVLTNFAKSRKTLFDNREQIIAHNLSKVNALHQKIK